MTAEQLALDCEPNWDDWFDEYEGDEDARPADLWGQGLPSGAQIDDIPLTGRYL
ncbi:hypothetical protein AB0H77_15570 [Streptomyces sp. NPDC050844]|uniref:hypothetical protein n=1 Tax=Streptomyces sp. NPDC050844 TaxID=3155790 RepID=UPI0033D5B3D0